MTVLPYSQCASALQQEASDYATKRVLASYESKNMMVAHVNGKLVGILIYKEPTEYYQRAAKRPSVYLVRIEVEKEYQRKNIATMLVRETLLKLQGLSIFIEVKVPKEGTPDICRFVNSLGNVEVLPHISVERETFLRYIIGNK